MKKAGIILIAGLMLMVVAGTAIAEISTPEVPVPTPDVQNQEFYQQMYEYCHGSNGMMNGYFGDGNNGATQGFGGMMGW